MINFDKYAKSAVTVDNVIFGFDEGALKVLLIKRGEPPYKNQWALPGNFVYPNEDLNAAAARVLYELTGLKNVYLEQVRTFGAVNRHPLGRVITIAYFSLIKIKEYQLQGTNQLSQRAKWVSFDKAIDLAFDHDAILEACFKRLQRRVRMRPVGFELLPKKFTLTELQHLYEAILQPDKKIDKRNFRKKILSMKILVDLKEVQEGVAHRPAKLYKFDKKKYQKFVEAGYIFEV
ncbi:MAG: NUDIX domain-containing protein [Bacteroidota bacterium]